MFKRPTTRRHSHSDQISLNLVPMLDALVTLIAFLLFTLSFLAVVGIGSPAPIASTEDLDEQLKENPLQLTLSLSPTRARIWSPFNRFKAVSIKNNPDGLPNLESIHRELVQIKSKFPKERKIVLVPNKSITYEVLVALMDAVRYLESADPVIYVTDENGVEREEIALFPKVIFGNLLGSSAS